MTRFPQPLAPVLLALALPGLCSAAGIERTFDVGPGGRLRVDAESTAVEVRGDSNAGVQIELTRRGDDAGEIEADYDVDISQNGNEVVVEIRRKRSWSFSRLFSQRSLELEVAVPNRFDADVDTSGGSVTVADLDGEVKAETSGGSLRLESIDGKVNGRTSGGGIHLDELSGPVEVKTSGGSIRIGEVGGEVRAFTSGGSIDVDHAGGPIEVKTSGGSIDIREARGAVIASTSGGSIRARILDQPADDCRLTTSGGSVTVSLEGGIALDIDAEASGGRVDSDLGGSLQAVSSSRSRLSGKLNGGGPTLLLRTSGGSVHLNET